MVSLLSDVQSKKPHFRFAGNVWSCTTYRLDRHSPYGAVFRIGLGNTWQQAWEDWKKQEFA